MKITSYKQISDLHLVTYEDDISREMCEDHGVDFNEKLLSSVRYKKFNVNHFRDVSIDIYSAVTSYARVFMSSVKFLSKDINIYYSDLDSIVGSGIGLFKLEDKILKGYFVS
jgi:hypothetical protein